MVRVIVAKSQLYTSCLDPYCTKRPSPDILKQLEDCKNIVFPHFSCSTFYLEHCYWFCILNCSVVSNLVTNPPAPRDTTTYTLGRESSSSPLASFCNAAQSHWHLEDLSTWGRPTGKQRKKSLKHPCLVLTDTHILHRTSMHQPKWTESIPAQSTATQKRSD